MNLNVENLVRSGVVLVVGLPIALSLAGLVNATSELARQNRPSAGELAQQTLKDQLTVPCVNYLVSDIDSKLERESANTIDDIFGGEVDHGNVCKWAL